MIPQLKELVVNYKPSPIFSDGGEWDGSEQYWKTRKRGANKQTAGEQELYFTTKADDLFCIFTQWTATMTIDQLETEEVKSIKMLGWEGEIPCLYAWTLQVELK